MPDNKLPHGLNLEKLKNENLINTIQHIPTWQGKLSPMAHLGEWGLFVLLDGA